MTELLRRIESGWVHFCPACERHHLIPGDREFNDDLDRPTFTHSNKLGGVWGIYQQDSWTGKWRYGEDGKVLPFCCHYIISTGSIQYQNDCTHSLAGRIMAMEPLRDWFDPAKFRA